MNDSDDYDQFSTWIVDLRLRLLFIMPFIAPSALRDLTKAMALNHLALLRTLSEHPGPQQSPEWIARVQSIHIILRELHERVNSYRGHQARGSLAKMLEVQIAERNEAAEKLKEARENVVKELEKVGVVLGNWLEARKGGKDMENG